MAVLQITVGVFLLLVNLVFVLPGTVFGFFLPPVTAYEVGFDIGRAFVFSFALYMLWRGVRRIASAEEPSPQRPLPQNWRRPHR